MPESTPSLAQFRHFREKMNQAIIPHLRRAVARPQELPAR